MASAFKTRSLAVAARSPSPARGRQWRLRRQQFWRLYRRMNIRQRRGNHRSPAPAAIPAATYNYGIYQAAPITNTGTGSITLNGTGGGSGNNEVGYTSGFFGGTSANVTAVTGNISITGIASVNLDGLSDRRYRPLYGTISTGGAGTITLAGTATGAERAHAHTGRQPQWRLRSTAIAAARPMVCSHRHQQFRRHQLRQ